MKTFTKTLFLGLFASASLTASAAEPANIYGIHDHDTGPGEYLDHIKNVVGSAWITATVAVGADPNNFSGEDFSAHANAGHTVICRINYGYFPDGTIPLPHLYDNFAARVKNFVQNSTGCTMWIIGNELNLPAEWPFDGNRFNYVSPQDYGTCYGKVANAIRSVRPNDKIMPAASAAFAGPMGPGELWVGWAAPHDGVPLNWVTYHNQLLADCKAKGPVDAVNLHVYSRGYTYGEIHNSQKINAGGQDLYFSFYVYKDWVDYGIPQNMWNLPIYVTECNGYYFWKGGHPEDPNKHYEPGWMQEVYAEINRYNQSAPAAGKPIIRCLNMYRWCGWCDGWNIDNNPYKGQILSDLDGAVAQRYTWAKPNDAAVVSISAPSSVTAGATFFATVQMRNRGSRTWTNAGGTPHRLGSQSPQDNTTWSFNRVNLPVSTVAPGQTVTFTFTARAPSTPGTYPFAWRMVQEAVEWFGDTASRNITVTSAAPAPIIVDNSDAGFTASANWVTGTTAPGKYGANYRFRSVQAVSDSATWNVTLPATGTYQVSAWWSAGGNRSTNAPYVISHNAGTTTVKVNQQINGGVWNVLGSWAMNSGARNVKLSCWTTGTNQVVMADAIRWQKQ